MRGQQASEVFLLWLSTAKYFIICNRGKNVHLTYTIWVFFYQSLGNFKKNDIEEQWNPASISKTCFFFVTDMTFWLANIVQLCLANLSDTNQGEKGRQVVLFFFFSFSFCFFFRLFFFFFWKNEFLTSWNVFVIVPMSQ